LPACWPATGSGPWPSKKVTGQGEISLAQHVIFYTGPMTSNPVGDTRWLSFDVHGRIRIGVARSAPTAAQMRTIFADFLTAASDEPFDLVVTGEIQPIAGVAYAEDTFSYTSDAITANTPPLQILRDGTGLRLNGPGELLTSVLPLLDRVLVERDVAMIHAATVAIHGHGIALPAAGGVGKTSTIAKLMRRPGVEFMGDDWAFVSAGGELLGFAKPMFIKPHHRTIYPHLFNRMRKPLVPKWLARPFGRLATRVHPVIIRYPRLAAFTRQWSPEHMIISPQEALQGAPIARSAPLSAAVYLERYDGTEARLRELDRPEMVARMLGNFHGEMTTYSREVVNLLGATGFVPLQDIFADKATVLGKALQNVPTFLLQVPVAYDADTASDVIVNQLATVTGLLGVSLEGNR
jgi:hypothetical protein